MVALVAERCRALCFRGAVDAAALRRTLVDLLAEGNVDRARRLLAGARPAYAVEPAWALLDPAIPDEERMAELDDRLLDLTQKAGRGLRALRIGASVASALGFLGAAFEIYWVFAGDHGLLRLQAGLVESIGLSRAVLSIGIGIATSSFAIGSWMVLRKRAREIVADGRRVLASVEEGLERTSG